MFELPNAKRVRREELSDRSRTSSPDVEIENELQKRLAELYGEESETPKDLALGNENATQSAPEPAEHAASDEEFEFRLFAQPPRNATRADVSNLDKGDQIVDKETSNLPISSKIRIASPERRSVSPGIITARPSSFYFSQPTDVDRERFAQSALESSSIVEESSRAWPGNHMPWRVIRVVVNSKPQRRLNDESKAEYIRPDMLSDERRKRPGKKRRLKTRKLKNKASAAKVAAEEQERLFREKKTKKNRERKVKRKKKAAKDAAAAEAGDVEMADGDAA